MKELNIRIKNTINPEKGKLLLSEPFLIDDYFTRSVILLCEHNEEGTFGFVLNNYTDISFKDINPLFPDIPVRVSIGGPVKPEHLYFIHTLDSEIYGGTQIHEKISLGGDFELILNQLEQDQSIMKHLRFFLGYSGWSIGQLDSELLENAWLVVHMPDSALVMGTENKDFWRELMQAQGGKYKLMSDFPLDPNMN
jgi:putative transcriptional regulator